MIEFTKSYKTSDGKLVETIDAAKQHELALVMANIIQDDDGNSKECSKDLYCEALAKVLLDNKDAIMDILTTTKNSKPKARAINGGTKKRTAKIVPLNTNPLVSVQEIQ